MPQGKVDPRRVLLYGFLLGCLVAFWSTVAWFTIKAIW